MKTRTVGNVGFGGALLVGLAFSLFAACGKSSAKHDGGAGHDGGGDVGHGSGDGAASLDAADAAGADAAPSDGNASDSPTADAADLDAATGDAADAVTGDAADAVTGDAADAVTGADADAVTGADADAVTGADAPDALAEIDAGAGCLAPGVETTLSATSEGLPANGLVLWVRGDRGVYKTAQNAVCAWRDQTSPTRLLHPSSGRPTWEATGVGGHDALHFSAVSQDMFTSDSLGIAATSARTFIAVSKLVNANGRFHPIIQGEASSPGTYFAIDANTWMTVGNREGVYAPLSSFDTALATTTTARLHILTASTMVSGTPVTTAIDYRVNGATQALTLKAGPGTLGDFSAANFITVGAVSGTPSAGVTAGDGYVAEALIYNRALTVEERVAVETALKARYAIP